MRSNHLLLHAFCSCTPFCHPTPSTYSPALNSTTMTYLAVAISAPDTDDAITALHRIAARADLAELRLNMMQSFDLPRLLAERPLPVIVTCRPVREGGRWRGAETERLDVLRQATSLGAEYVDLEWDVATEATTMDRSRSQVILSRHDFAGMPSDLPAQAEALWAAGADVVKIVGMAQRLSTARPCCIFFRLRSGPQLRLPWANAGWPRACWHSAMPTLF